MASGPGAMPIPPRGKEHATPLRSEAAGSEDSMYHVTNGMRRHCAPAPAALLLLALCLFLVGTGQAAAGPMETTALADANATNAQTAALAPYPGTHEVPGIVQAKDYDLGGEGVAYHDTEPANLGGAYRPAEGVDIETAGLFTDVGWVRSGEWLDLHGERDRTAGVHRLVPGREPGRDHEAGRHPGRRRSCRDGRSPADRVVRRLYGLQFDTHLAPRGGDRDPALVRRGLTGQPVRIRLPAGEPARADSRPDARTRAPRLHARPPHPRRRPLFRPYRRHDHEF